MSNTSESFVRSMHALCADQVRLHDLRLGLLVPIEELVSTILGTLDDLPENWPLRTSRPPSQIRRDPTREERRRLSQ